jgi:hypothetical protein
MEQIPSWEANRSSANQEIPCSLQNPELHYCICKSPWKFFLNIILPSTHRSSNPMTLIAYALPKDQSKPEAFVNGS